MSEQNECPGWQRPDIIERAAKAGMTPRKFWTAHQQDPLTRESTGRGPAIPTVNLSDILPDNVLSEIRSKDRGYPDPQLSGKRTRRRSR